MIFYWIVLDLYTYDMHKNAEKPGVISFLSQILCEKAVCAGQCIEQIPSFSCKLIYNLIQNVTLPLHLYFYRNYTLDYDDGKTPLNNIVDSVHLHTELQSRLVKSISGYELFLEMELLNQNNFYLVYTFIYTGLSVHP